MEDTAEPSLLVCMLTTTQSIPYEILKYYGFAKHNVRLMSGLWKKTMELYLKIKHTSFFDSMMEIVTVDVFQIKLIWDEIEREQKRYGWNIDENFDQILEQAESNNWIIESYKNIANFWKIKYNGWISTVFD